jgi:hypothetical protein
MRSRRLGRILPAVSVVSLVLSAVLVSSPDARAADEPPPSPAPCADLPEENHASIRLQVDQPAADAEVAVDEQGKIAISGILHKHAVMVDVADEDVTSTEFVIGPPPDGVAAWASSWTTGLRPPHLGPNQLCARAERDPKRVARVLRSFTVVDLIPPSAVPGLAVSDITATTARVTWDAATDNYGLAGYEVTVDGGAARRTTVGTRSFTITGLAPSSSHTVSVVAIDLAGNRSTTPATASFTTAAAPQPPGGDFTFAPQQGGATATWQPDLPVDVTYRVLLDGLLYDEFPVAMFCQDSGGNPASPCTEQHVISYPIDSLEEGTPYTLRVEALRADGTTARSLTGSFTTTTSPDTVPPEITQLVASETSRCAGTGGDFYVAPDARAGVPVPAGSTQLFEGCYRVPNSSCLDAFLPPSGNRLLDCADDLTRLLFAVAPSGRGPVISSIAVPGQRTLVEPLTWCSQGACALLLAPPAQAVRLVVLAPAAAASTSLIAVAAAGIGIGIALGVLLAILFPGTIGIAGLLEYPIHFNDNFDTFDNWGADEGEWYNSLKVYAEVIKTTTLVADENNIPFVWSSAEDARLKRVIDGACTAQQGSPPGATAGCGDDVAVYVPGGRNYLFQPMQETGDHIVAAMGTNGFPQPPARNLWYYPGHSVNGQAAQNAGHKRNWYDTDVRFLPNACVGRPVGKTCDEFPFWTTDQAVNLSGIVADVLPVPTTESLPQANDLSGFYRQCDVADGDRFIVLPVRPWVAAGGPSFGFRVSPGGASLCMPPRPPGGP